MFVVELFSRVRERCTMLPTEMQCDLGRACMEPLRSRWRRGRGSGGAEGWRPMDKWVSRNGQLRRALVLAGDRSPPLSNGLSAVGWGEYVKTVSYTLAVAPLIAGDVWIEMHKVPLPLNTTQSLCRRAPSASGRFDHVQICDRRYVAQLRYDKIIRQVNVG